MARSTDVGDARPWLSVVIPALDEAAGIVDCLQPLQHWRSRGVEVLLVDGGSQDATLSLASPLVDAVVHAPAGRARQMNAGAERAAGGWLLFLHADTWLDERALATLEQVTTTPRWGRFDVRLRGRHPMLPVIAWSMNLRSRLSGIATGDQCLFMHRSLFDTVNGFPDQPLMEDVEICARLRRLQRPLCLRVPVKPSARRWLEHGVWRTMVLMWGLRWRYFRGADPADLHRAYYS